MEWLTEVAKPIVKTKVAPKTEIKRPRLYKVFLMNDDYTPMDFVVEVLQLFFSIEQTKAISIMLQIHRGGKGICGVYSHDIAETKVAQVNQYARDNEYPLMCNMEAVQ